ncbi:MAG: ATP-binding protein, partial [Nitrosarchaeum sp.]
DNGIGIPQNKLETIFERFKQVDESTSRKYGGTGLGLAISKELAILLGGDIKVESIIEKGSTFTLIIEKNIQLED